MLLCRSPKTYQHWKFMKLFLSCALIISKASVFLLREKIMSAFMAMVSKETKKACLISKSQIKWLKKHLRKSRLTRVLWVLFHELFVELQSFFVLASVVFGGHFFVNILVMFIEGFELILHFTHVAYSILFLKQIL